MKDFRRVNNVVGWIVFIIAAFTYLSTMEGTASLWDCSEFITSTYKLQIGHPPGAPFFNILGRVLTLFSGSAAWTAAPSADAAIFVNAMSAVSSALTILFLFWSISHLARKLLVKEGEEITWSTIITCVGAGAVGALAYTFSDTFWFSAVEGEVYAMSSLFTAAVFWLILKWEDNADSVFCNRWLIIIVYLMGLSIGVHLLNLLILPAMALVYYFKKYTFSVKGVLVTLAISMGLIVVMMYGIVPGIPYVASRIDLFTTNTLSFPINVGTLLYLTLLLVVLVVGIYTTGYSDNKLKSVAVFSLAVFLIGIPFVAGGIGGFVVIACIFGLLYYLPYRPKVLNIMLTGMLVFFIGYSSFALVVIRSAANPPMDENSPDDAFTLQSYLNRDQYGATPLITGRYYSSLAVKSVDDGPDYRSVDGKYKVIASKSHMEFEPTTTFPRMWSSQANHVQKYQEWAGMKGPKSGMRKLVMGREVFVPTKAQEFKYFLNYQVVWMYWRYFFWNFAGRQNDAQGNGDAIHGNWISGIDFIDKGSVGSSVNLPSRMKNDPTHNVYYMLPFLLGMIGLFFQLFHKQKGLEGFLIVALFFLMTGLAIVLYLNQPPLQPRERDYAYAGSFYAFAIWIGLGIIPLIQWVKEERMKRVVAFAVTAIALLLVPGVMAQQNWADHNRSRRSVANDLAYNYLMSCAPNAIIFTYGDNDTFPLWYMQEVEGVRTDVRVCNLSYLQIDWYIEQMAKRAYDSAPFPFSLTPDKYLGDKRNTILLRPNDYVADLKDAMDFIGTDDHARMLRMQNGEYLNYLPTQNFKLKVDTAKVLANGDVPADKRNKVVSEIDFSIKKEYITKQEMMILDLLANNHWNRPIYFATSVGSNMHLGLSNYLQNEGFAYRLVPVNSGGLNTVESMNTDIMYDNVMNKFRYGGLNKPGFILMDYQAARMFLSLRQTMLGLAQGLMAKGQNDKAYNVIERCLKELPDRNLPLGYCSNMEAETSSLQMAEMLGRLNKKDEALALLKEMGDQSKEEVIWYAQQSPQIQARCNPFMDRSSQVYMSVGQLESRITGDPKILQEYQKTLQQIQVSKGRITN